QGWSLYFCGLWLLVTLIPFDAFYATRQAQVSATLDGISVPAVEIQSIKQALGLSPYYTDTSYCNPSRITEVFVNLIFLLKLVGVLPWFALLFPVIAGFVLQLAAGH
ncbi:hypothetical protein EDD15DRAFT_2149176, partial [Pisolithus albus]